MMAIIYDGDLKDFVDPTFRTISNRAPVLYVRHYLHAFPSILMYTPSDTDFFLQANARSNGPIYKAKDEQIHIVAYAADVSVRIIGVDDRLLRQLLAFCYNSNTIWDFCVWNLYKKNQCQNVTLKNQLMEGLEVEEQDGPQVR